MLFDVRKTIGICLARTVPSSGIDTWYSERISSSKRLGLEFHAVDLVDQQHDRVGRRDRLEQRPREEELLAEDVLFELFPVLGALALRSTGLDAQELLAVVPLVERLGVVQALVALEADQSRADRVGDGARERGLAGAGRALDEDRLGEAVGEEADRGDGVVGSGSRARRVAAGRPWPSRSAPAGSRRARVVWRVPRAGPVRSSNLSFSSYDPLETGQFS